MKDLNWEKRGNKLQLGPQKRKLFITQLLRDVKVRFIMSLFMPLLLCTYCLYFLKYKMLAFGPNEHHGLQFDDWCS